MLERISKKIFGKTTKLFNKEKWLNLLKEVLPYKAKNKLEMLIREKEQT